MKKMLIRIRNGVIHVLVLLLIFVLSLVGFERWINQSVPVTAEGMENSSYPLVYIQNNGVSYNCLHGYAYEMDVTTIRDTVTVLSSDHELDIQIQPFSSSIDSISYEVLTLDGKESLENTNVVKIKEENNYLYATLEIQNHMLMNQEYILKLKVEAGGRSVYFYTRLVLEDGLHLSSYLEFVTGFYEKCVNRTDQTSLGTYVEPDKSSGKETTLAKMDIHATVNQLMWGSLNPQIYYKPTPSLVDINKTTASFVLEYRIASAGEKGNTELYNVKEFYRLRYTDTRIFLLDFTRTTDEIFQTERSVLEGSSINLGITNMDLEYRFDARKKVVAFVQENELWSYNISLNKLTHIFGFPQKENMDYRDFYDKNNIEILRVDAGGSVWFAVSGYMNRGKHEGENGVGIYHYDEASATVEEIAFIQTMESYDMLKLDVHTLSYISGNETKCYLLLDGIVYRINLETLVCEKLIEGIRNNCYAGSESSRYFAWLEDGKEYDSSVLKELDMETGDLYTFTAGDGERIRPLGFMGEDLIYGTARVTDMDLSHKGNEVFPMYRLTIVGTEGEELKRYEPSGIYVTKTEMQDNMMNLQRVTKAGKTYEEAPEDHIVNTNVQDDVVYGISTKTSSVRQTEILLRLGASVPGTAPQVVASKLLAYTESKTIRIPVNPEKEPLYYVYAGGQMEARFTNAGPAIREANEKVGVVINESKDFVWERGNKETTKRIKLDSVPKAFRTGTMDVPSLEKAMNQEVLDLTGCTLEMILYFVSQGRAVLAKTPEKIVTIVGYDEYNVILLDPGSEETYYGGMKDSTKLFEEAGNEFLSYMN